MLVIVPPAMVSDWREDTERFWVSHKDEQRSGTPVLIIGHESQGKGANKVNQFKKDLIGISLDPPTELEEEEQPDPDAKLLWNDRMEKFVLTSPVKGKYRCGTPQPGSSRFLIITTTLSYDGHVQSPLTKRGPDYYIGPKQGKVRMDKGIALVCPAIIIIDEAHLVRQEDAGHFAVVTKIQKACSSLVRTGWLSGTPIGKRPSDLAAIFAAMQYNGPWLDGELKDLNRDAMNRIDKAYFELEISIRKGSRVHSRELRQTIDVLTKDLTEALSKIMVRHTSDSLWFGKPIKEPIAHSDIDKSILFPSDLIPSLEAFDKTMKQQLKAVAQGKKISATRLLSSARFYRIISSLPGMLKFWGKAENLQYHLTSEEMKIWIVDGEISQDCPVYPYLDDILSSSPKLDYIGSVLDAWKEGEGKLLVFSDFIFVAAVVNTVCLLLFLTMINIERCQLTPSFTTIVFVFLLT